MRKKRDTEIEMPDVSGLLLKSELEERLDAISNLTKDLAFWRPATEVLTRVRSVPTIFPDFDRVSKVGGYPIERVNTVHGPSNHGKTAMALGLGLSFLKRGHIFAHIDAEMTTPAEWVQTIFGDLTKNPGFVALRPRNYEQAVDAVKALAEKVANKRSKGLISEDTTVLFVVDSIRKLIPKDLIKKLDKEGGGALGGRSAQLKARMNQAWLDELTPLMYHTGCGLLIIAREMQDPSADEMSRKYHTDWKVQGGAGLVYDASLVFRVTRSSWTRETSAKDSRIIGEKIKVSIWKTKVMAKDGKTVEAFFHTSNGVDGYEGFDHARDVLAVAGDMGIVTVAGSWYSYGEKKLGQGSTGAVKALRKNDDLLAEIEDKCRKSF